MTVQNMNVSGNRYNGSLLALKNGRSLLRAQSPYRYKIKQNLPLFESEPFTEEKEAIEQLGVQIADTEQGQAGEGVFDVARSVFKYGKKAMNLATGPVGTNISNVLSKKFNKNPNWRPGFPGEAHLVLPTDYGLTRSNFCGPKTNLRARIARGDRGVSQIDTSCKLHDTLYSTAKSVKDIRKADERLISDINKATDAGWVQKNILKAGLRAKTLGEDVGIFGAETFTEIPGLHKKGQGGGRSLSNIPNIGFRRVNKFYHDCPRDVRSLKHNTTSNIKLPLMKRMGGNGIISPSLIEQDNLMRLERRLNERNAIRKINSAQCTNYNFKSAQCSKNNKVNFTGKGVSHPNKQIKWERSVPYNLSPTQAVDHSVRKAIDPTIRNMIGKGPYKTADPGGGGIKEDILEIVEKPGDLLKKNVLKKLEKESKKNKIVKAGFDAGKVIVPELIKLIKKEINKNKKLKNQTGGQLGLLASLAANILLPEIIKLFKGKKGKGHQKGGQLGLLATLAANIIIPEIIKAFKKKK